MRPRTKYLPLLISSFLVVLMIPVTLLLVFQSQTLGIKALGCKVAGENCVANSDCCKGLWCVTSFLPSGGALRTCKKIGLLPSATPTRVQVTIPPKATTTPSQDWVVVGCYRAYPPCNCPPTPDSNKVVCWYNAKINSYTCTADYNHFCAPTPTPIH